MSNEQWDERLASPSSIILAGGSGIHFWKTAQASGQGGRHGGRASRAQASSLAGGTSGLEEGIPDQAPLYSPTSPQSYPTSTFEEPVAPLQNLDFTAFNGENASPPLLFHDTFQYGGQNDLQLNQKPK